MKRTTAFVFGCVFSVVAGIATNRVLEMHSMEQYSGPIGGLVTLAVFCLAFSFWVFPADEQSAAEPVRITEN